jgi:hypothetical protein
MITKQEVIEAARQKTKNINAKIGDEELYHYGVRFFPEQEIEPFSGVYEPQKPQEETSSGFVNFLWEFADYGVDENSSDWWKASYNKSLTSLSENLIKGGPKYELSEEYNPGYLSDITSTVMGFLYPVDLITMAFGGFLGKVGGKGVSKVATSAGSKLTKAVGVTKKVEDGTSVVSPVLIKAVDGMFQSAGALAAYEGSMLGTQAAIDGEDTKGILSAIGEGVVHGGMMGAAIGLTAGGMGAKHFQLQQLAKKRGLTTGEKALSAATSFRSVIAAETSVFSAPQMYKLFNKGIVDDKGNVTDARLKDYTKVWMENAGLVMVLKGQNKARETLAQGYKKVKDAVLKPKAVDKTESDMYSDLIDRLEKDVDISAREKLLVKQKKAELESKIENEMAIERTEIEKTFRLGEKSFEKDLTKNPELLISRMNFVKRVESEAINLANKSTGKDKAMFENIADMYTKEVNKMNEAITGYKLQNNKIVKVEELVKETVEPAKERKIIQHFTKKENISNIIKKGFDTALDPIFGVVEGLGKVTKAKKKFGKNTLYFTTDKKKWSEGEVYVGEGKGNKDYNYYDYDAQKHVTEKNALQTIKLESVDAAIKDGSKVLTIDSINKYLDFQNKNMDRASVKERLGDVINKAKELGYDVVNIKKTDKWKKGGKDVYEEATGSSGKDDYFVLNKKSIDIIDPSQAAKEVVKKPIKKVESPKLKSQEMKEQLQVKVKDLEVKLQEQIKVDKAKEKQILQKANQADVSRYNALELQRQKGTIDKKGSGQLGYLRKKLFKQGAIESPQVRSLRSQIAAEKKTITGLDRNIKLLTKPTKKITTAVKEISKQKHDVMRTRPELYSNVTNAEVKSPLIDKKTIKTVREDFLGVDNVFKATKAKLETYVDFLSKSEAYKGKSLKEKQALYEASVAEANSSIPLKERLKEIENRYDVKKGEDFTSIKDVESLKEWGGLLRLWERTKSEPTMSEIVLSTKNKKMMVPMWKRLVTFMPAWEVLKESGLPELGNRLNLWTASSQTYSGAFKFASNSIAKKLGKNKLKDNFYLYDKQRLKERKELDILTSKDKEYIELSKDKNSDVSKANKEWNKLADEIYETFVVTLSQQRYFNIKKFRKDFPKKRVMNYLSRIITPEFYKSDWRKSPEIKDLLQSRIDKAIKAEMKKKGKKKTEGEIRNEQEKILFDAIDAPSIEVDSKFFNERGVKVPEIITVKNKFGKEKKIESYETEFSRIIEPYIFNMSQFISTLEHFPEWTKIGNEFGVKGATRRSLLETMSNDKSLGAYAKQTIEHQIGAGYKSMTTYDKGAQKLSTITVAAGLSSPTSALKNFVLGTRGIAHFKLWNTLNGYRRAFTTDGYIEASKRGVVDYESRTLEFQAKDLIGKVSYQTVHTFTGMRATENRNRAAHMFAGRAYFNGITQTLRGDRRHFLQDWSVRDAERGMRDIFRLTEGEIQFLKKTKDLENLNIDGIERMYIIERKVDTFSHIATQGGTSPANLPLWMSNKHVKPFTIFTRIASSVTNDTYKNILKPMYTHGNFAPFIATTASSYLGGALLFETFERLFGLQKPAKPNSFLDDAIANLHRAEYLGMFTEILNPYKTNEGLPNPLTMPIIVNHYKNAETNFKAWWAESKTLGQAADDFAKKTVVIYGQARKGIDYRLRDKTGLQADTKKIQTLVMKWQNDTDRVRGTGGSSKKPKRKPYYRRLEEQFYFGSEKDFARAYWATYNYIATELIKDKLYNPNSKAGAARIHKETKAAIQLSMRNYKPISLSDDGDGVIMNKTELNQFKDWIGDDKKSLDLLEKAMRTYEFRKRKLEREIHKYFRSESAMAGFVDKY